jgi:hypothetical protein
MAVELWIDDGTPHWYLSPDIWVVPSDDPNDPPGMPFANVSAYVWARVHNRGSTAVSNATVRYYWANPSTAITPTTATLIGTSSASLAAGETKDVLCVTPWVPQWVNDGHECLLAQAFAPADPLPPLGPMDPFNVPGDRHTAQKNLTVGGMAGGMAAFIHTFLVMNTAGLGAETVQVRARRGAIADLKPLAAGLGLRALPEEADGLDRFGVQPYRCGDELERQPRQETKLELRPGAQQGMALVVHLARERKPNAGALFLVEQFAGDRLVGGVGVLLVPEAEENGPNRPGRPDRPPRPNRSK